MGNSSNALIIFARKPQLGKVKTRLAKTIGDVKTLDIYLKLLQHTRFVAKQAGYDCFVFLTETTDDDFWDGFFCELQQGETLGEKMQHAFDLVFKKGYKHCVIIGSDCPGLDAALVNDAFVSLALNDITIGPAEDGGYYLLGMKKMFPQLFTGKEWSTAQVYQQTIHDIEKLQLKCKVLPVLNDVDEEKDVPVDWFLDVQ